MKCLCCSLMNGLNQPPIIIHKPGQRPDPRGCFGFKHLCRHGKLYIIGVYTLSSNDFISTTVDALDVVSRNAAKLLLARLAWFSRGWFVLYVWSDSVPRSTYIFNFFIKKKLVSIQTGWKVVWRGLIQRPNFMLQHIISELTATVMRNPTATSCRLIVSVHLQ